MSFDQRRDSTFVDVKFLRDHVTKLREDKKYASDLYDSIARMKHCSDPAEAERYNAALRDAEQLIGYFGEMAKLLDHVVDEAVQLSDQIGTIIEDDAEQARRKTSSAYML